MNGGSDNSGNRLVARLFCEEITDENGNIALMLKDNLSENPYLQGDFYFGYTGKGWSEFREFFIMVSVMSGLVVILYLGCWLAVLVLAGAVMAVSALCKRSFGSLIWSIGLPFSYALMFLNAPAALALVMAGVEVVVGSVGAVLSVSGWCRHQVGE